MQCNYNSYIQIINFHGLFSNALRCWNTGACRILVPVTVHYQYPHYKFHDSATCFLICAWTTQKLSLNHHPHLDFPGMSMQTQRCHWELIVLPMCFGVSSTMQWLHFAKQLQLDPYCDFHVSGTFLSLRNALFQSLLRQNFPGTSVQTLGCHQHQ